MAEQQAAPALPEALQTEIRGLATEAFNYWKANSSEAQRAVGMSDMEKFTNDPAFIEQEMTAMQTAFDAQSPVDGRLDVAKYVAWINALQTAGEARGNFEDRRED